MAHKIVFLDFETYYDDQYSLRKMTPANYILDQRFEAILMAVKELDVETGRVNSSSVVDGPDIPRFLDGLDADRTTVVAFNALFDSCILAWRYRFVPRRTLCTMRMAVALRGHMLQGHSLAAIGKSLELGVKGTEIEAVKGMRRADILRSGRWERFCDYALNDNEMNYAIFCKLIPEFPSSEQRVMDLVLRCALEPQFWINRAMLTSHLEELQQSKAALLAKAGLADGGDLRSTPKFEALLKSYGVEITYKTTATGNTAPAFAKTDAFMQSLLEHELPEVQALAAARLGMRSTIEETRGVRMLSIGSLNWAPYRGGNVPLMPVPLRYSGAHTHRLSGEWLLNLQNLPAARGTAKSKLRRALIAPPGHQVIAGDLEQIECRVTAWLCGQKDLLDTFARGEDPYASLASAIFNIQCDKRVHKTERFIGKSGELGLGFRCGADRFYSMVVASARNLGMDIPELLKIWTAPLAQRTVSLYRGKRTAIVNTWYKLDGYLATAWIDASRPVQFGPCRIGAGRVDLPNGLALLYKIGCTDPRADCGLTYYYGRHGPYSMHGGKMLENIVQGLARIILFNAALRIAVKGLRFKLQVHDELVYIVPDAAVEEAKALIHEEMIKPPSWAPDLPLGAEVKHGPSYGEAK